MIERQPTALISGAGIAGSTLAYWLARSGWRVTVVESAGAARSSGNPVDVRGEAATIAHDMGIWPRLEAAATGVSRLAFVDRAGRERASIGTRQSSSAHDEVEVARAALAAVLLEAASTDADIRLGDRITALRQDATGVEAELEHSSGDRFDLVMGADGLHSGVRRIAFGPESGFARPFGMFVGTVRADIETGDPETVLMLNEPGRSLSVHPAGGSPLAAFIFRDRRKWDHRDPDAGRRIVDDVYAGSGPLAERALAAWRSAPDVYFDAVTRIAVPSWSTGRVALVGDAADCLSLFGEGSSNAIVAARTLARSLDAHPGDHSAAFAEYERLHRLRVRSFRRGARLGSHLLVPSTGAGIALRDAGVALASRLTGRRPATPQRAGGPRRNVA